MSNTEHIVVVTHLAQVVAFNSGVFVDRKVRNICKRYES